MTRLRDFVVPLLGDARCVLVMVAVAALFVLLFVGRCVVAVVQDIAGGARRLWE